MTAWQYALIIYAGMTCIFAGVQMLENRTARPGDPLWAPAWWIALTWPVWLVVIALDLCWAPHWRGRK